VNNEQSRGDVVAATKVGLLIGASGAALTAVASAVGLASGATIFPTGVALGLATTALHYWKTQHARIVADEARTTRRRLDLLAQQVAETQGLVQLGSLRLPYPLAFGGDYALTADAAAVLARQVALRRPKLVVELGSGVSTILVGCLLRDQGGGRLISLDHDPVWAEETRKQIRAAGLEGCAEVLDAPLTRQDIEGQSFNWYAIPEKVKQLAAIDLLIVDGPPQAGDPGGLPRYPALPKLLPQLSPNAEIFVDDAKRPGETEMVRRWVALFPGWIARDLPTGPGTCLLYRGNPDERREPDA
jgi:predicted O-methyltransferase YrrM